MGDVKGVDDFLQKVLDERGHELWFEVRTIHHSFTELFSLLFIDGNPAGAKSMLNAMGFIENKLRLPLVPTRITTFEKIRDVLRQLSIKC